MTKTKQEEPSELTRRWQDVGPYPGLTAHHWTPDARWFVSAMLPGAVSGGPPVRFLEASGDCKTSLDELERAVSGLGLHLIFTASSFDGIEARVFACAKGIVRLRTRLGDAEIEAAFTDEDLDRRVREIAKNAIVDTADAEGLIHALVRSKDGSFRVHEVGIAGVALERGNYRASVLDDYDHVLADFRTKGPCGRLVVVSGEPGSGKSFLVRGLLTALAHDCRFVLVPPHLVERLGDPELLPALIAARKDEDAGLVYAGPIVLVCEDGDHCLTRRGADNMSSVQSILNMGDGLMGSMLDLRLVITTNAKKVDMDEAVSRDGRLCRRIDIGRLEPKEANRVLDRLVPARAPCEIFTEGHRQTLAQVYKKARALGWVPPGTATREAAT